MSLGLNPEPSRYVSSPIFNEAVNDAQFVRTFGIIACVGSLLTFVSGAIAIGLGAAVLGFGHGRFFKVLGGAVLALGAGSLFLPVCGPLGSVVLGSGVAWKATQTLGALEREGKGDPDWQMTQRRAVVGLVLGSIGGLVGLCWTLLVLIAMALGARSA